MCASLLEAASACAATVVFLNHKINTMTKLLLSVLAFPLLMAFTTPSTTVPDGRPLYAVLSGANEVPGPGDPDGSGYAMLQLNQGQGTIYYELTVENIEPARAAHIHIGGSTVAGPVLIHLEAPTDGFSSGTITDVDPELIKAMRKNPKAYYVNVHNAPYPGGAVRGQLYK